MVITQVLCVVSAAAKSLWECAHPMPTLNRAIAKTFFRSARRSLTRYGIGNAMMTASVMRLIMPIAK